jgi:hypothetical protein
MRIFHYQWLLTLKQRLGVTQYMCFTDLVLHAHRVRHRLLRHRHHR